MKTFGRLALRIVLVYVLSFVIARDVWWAWHEGETAFGLTAAALFTGWAAVKAWESAKGGNDDRCI